jgi:hypothetical protein
MSARIGLAVSRRHVRAVLVRRGSIVWHGARSLGENELSSEALGELLRSIPTVGGRFRLGLVAAVGPYKAQAKQLAALPAVRDTRLLDQAVRENAARFFLRGAQPPATTRVWRSPSGEFWCAAYDADLLRTIIAACRDVRVAFLGAVPAAVAAGRATQAGAGRWRDEKLVVDFDAPDGEPRVMRRYRAVPMDGELAPPLTERASELGEEAWSFADAYGAATYPLRAPLIWRALDSQTRPHTRLLRGTLVALSSVMAFATAAGPGIRASLAAREARIATAPLRAALQTAHRIDAELRAVSADIDGIQRYASSRRSSLGLVAGLAQTLPESTAIVSLRVDTLGGTMVTLSRRAADIVPQLRDVAGIATSHLYGSATREIVAGASLERATIRFALERRAR